jgi:hypothetical protein
MTRGVIGILLLGLVMAATEDKERDAAVSLARKALCGKLGVNADVVQVDKVEPVDWPDASLGCPEKGMMYAQMITPGYKVSLKVDAKTYPVHVGAGRAVVCGTPSKSPRAPTGK